MPVLGAGPVWTDGEESFGLAASGADGLEFFSDDVLSDDGVSAELAELASGPEGPAPAGSAHDTPVVTATPTPNATANAPTLPTHAAAPTAFTPLHTTDRLRVT
ncbi:MAG: hypothetical protein QOH60_2311 [Mycobacterium sp.]|nr:hypothetical protein [Mycobacterium sp.]